MKQDFTKKILANGITVLHEKRSIPATTVAFAARYGYGYEPMKTKGAAHFLEHMAFKGTPSRTTEQISKEVEQVGGELNAFTSDEMTAYHVKLPSRHFQKGVDVISDIFFNPLVKQEELEKERNVILEEIKMYHDDPRRYVLERIKELLYEKPFGAWGTGSKESLMPLKSADLLQIHDLHYFSQPVLCVVGKTDVGEVVAFAEKLKLKKMDSNRASVDPQRSQEQAIEKRDVQQVNLVLGMHCSSLADGKRYGAQAFTTILADGMSSRMFLEIREKRGLAYAVKGFLDQGKHFGYIGFYVGTEKGKDEQVKGLLLEEIKKMQKLESKDLDEAKEQMLGSYELQEEDSRNAAFGLIQEELAGKAENYYAFEEQVKAIKLEDVRALGKMKGYSYVALVPKE